MSLVTVCVCVYLLSSGSSSSVSLSPAMPPALHPARPAGNLSGTPSQTPCFLEAGSCSDTPGPILNFSTRSCQKKNPTRMPLHPPPLRKYANLWILPASGIYGKPGISLGRVQGLFPKRDTSALKFICRYFLPLLPSICLAGAQCQAEPNTENEIRKRN